jgi:hypothetical protein
MANSTISMTWELTLIPLPDASRFGSEGMQKQLFGAPPNMATASCRWLIRRVTRRLRHLRSFGD